jgi:hypothetical protein
MVGILSPVLELSKLTFEILEGGTVTDLLGTAEIPITLTIDPGTLWEYRDLDPSHLTVSAQERWIGTGDTTTFAMSGEVDLLGELVPFIFTRPDMINLDGQTTLIVDGGGAPPSADSPSSTIPEFRLFSDTDLQTAGELIANDFAEVQGLSLTLRAYLNFGATEIHYIPLPEPAVWLGQLSGAVLLSVLYRRRNPKS